MNLRKSLEPADTQAFDITQFLQTIKVYSNYIYGGNLHNPSLAAEPPRGLYPKKALLLPVTGGLDGHFGVQTSEILFVRRE